MEIIPAPFLHTQGELKRAVREHAMHNWRDWLEEDYPRPLVIRLFDGALSSPTFLMPGMAFGAGHLGATSWVEEGWGIHIRNEEARELAEELRAQLAPRRPAYGYVRLTPVDAFAASVGSECPYLVPVLQAIASGAEEAFLPVEIVRVTIHETKQTRLRPFLPHSPAP